VVNPDPMPAGTVLPAEGAVRPELGVLLHGAPAAGAGAGVAVTCRVEVIVGVVGDGWRIFGCCGWNVLTAGAGVVVVTDGGGWVAVGMVRGDGLAAALAGELGDEPTGRPAAAGAGRPSAHRYLETSLARKASTGTSPDPRWHSRLPVEPGSAAPMS
jgi:hypothetical protein